MPVLRLTIADLELLYALTAFMQSRQTDPDFMMFVDSLMDELPEVPAGPATMPQASSGWSRLACATIASYVAWSMVSTASSLGRPPGRTLIRPAPGRAGGLRGRSAVVQRSSAPTRVSWR